MTDGVPMPDHAVTHPHGLPNGTTVFLLHGAFGAKEYWRAQVLALAQTGCRVVAWDAPGYGLSPLPAGFGIDLCARALARLLEKEGGARNIVLGHSMGGFIAQRAWLYARGRIQGYVLSATSAAFGKPDGDFQREFVRQRVAPLDAGLTIAQHAPGMLRRMTASGAEGPGVDLLVSTVSQMREETFRAAVAAIAAYEGREILPTIDVPVLCVAGELDTTAPAAVMEKMAARIAGAEFVALEGLGHFGWAEAPDRFNASLLGFLRRRGLLG